MKTLFKEYVNKLKHKRNIRENLLFFITLSVIYNFLIIKNTNLILILSMIIKTPIIIFLVSFLITTILNIKTYSSYLNPYIRSALEIKTRTAFIFHILKLFVLQFIFTAAIIYQLRYSLNSNYQIFIYLLINPLLITISMKNVKTLIMFLLSNVFFLIQLIINTNIWIYIVLSTIIILLNTLVFKNSTTTSKKGTNKIKWLPKHLLSETLVLTIRQSKIMYLIIISFVLSIFYFSVPYNKQFDVFEWLSNITTFNKHSSFHIPILLIILIGLNYILQFQVFATTFDKQKLYIQGNSYITIHKFIVVFLLILISNSLICTLLLHVDSKNMNLLWTEYSKMPQISGWGLDLVILPTFILSIISVIKINFNKVIKIIVFYLVISLPYINQIIKLVNFDPYSIIMTSGISITCIAMYIIAKRKEKNELFV